MMKLSVIICMFESYEAARRQALHFSKMDLPDDIEFIFVDDGSQPPHPQYPLKNLTMVYTNDTRPWTQGIARNTGVKAAKGEHILCTDIDHILSKEVIMACHDFTGHMMIFPRYLGVLTEDGTLTQDPDILVEYGMDPERLTSRRGLYASYHGNTYCMRRDVFWELGGNEESHCVFGHHATSKRGEDSVMNRRWNHWANARGIKTDVGPQVYIFPVGRYHVKGELNPGGMFHTLSYEPVPRASKYEQ